jgi:ribonuclease Z
MPSHNLESVTIDGLDVIGYSVAGEETVVAIKELDVCFDVGKAPEQIISISNILLTHGHMDHAAGIAYYLSHRKFTGQKPGTVLAPPNLLKPMQDIIDAWGKLDGNQIPVNLVGVKAGDEYKIKPNLVAKAFPTKHSRGSVGYTVIEKRKKLKDEFVGLMGKEIVELKKKGVTIERNVDIPIVTYLGDTRYVDFSQLDYIAKSKILIAECTFFADEHIERADAGKHIHIDEFTKLIGKLDNEHIIITHMTQRTGMGEIKKILREKLGTQHYSRITLLMDRYRNS